MSHQRRLTSIFTASCHPPDDAAAVQATTDDFVPSHISHLSIPTQAEPNKLMHAPDTRQILRTTSSKQDNAVLLQRMSFTRYIRMNTLARAELHSRDFSLGRVGLFGLHDKYLSDNTLLVWVSPKQRRLAWFGLLRVLPTCCLIERARGGGGGMKMAQKGESGGGIARKGMLADKC